MVSEVDRATIVRLSEMGRSQAEIVRITGIPLSTIQYSLRRFRQTGQTKDRPRSGRPKTASSPNMVKRIREKIRYDAKRSMRKMAKELNIGVSSVRRIVKKGLGLLPIKFQKTHALTDKMKATRLQRCKELRKRFSAADTQDIVFTDEKLFNIEQTFNRQNDRILASSVQDANQNGRNVSRSGHPQQVMVFAGITGTGKTDLIFVDPGVKINAQVYLDDILKKHVLPWTQKHFKGKRFTFQQDSAPAHKAKVVQDWCKNSFPDFITTAEWPPYSPDLNPMDFSVWSVLEAKACSTPHKNLESLKRALLKAWDELDADYLSATVAAFRDRLKKCIDAKGGIFENA